MISESELDAILDQVESGLRSMMGYKSQSDAKMPDESMKDFVTNQYDVKLCNFLESAGSNIHHLESGAKNKIISRKHRFFENL